LRSLLCLSSLSLSLLLRLCVDFCIAITAAPDFVSA
jgi:hypothetical protein